METSEQTNSAQPLNPGKVAWTAGFCGLMGVGLLLIVAGLMSVGSPAAHRSSLLKALVDGGVLATGILIYLVTPLLALLTSSIVWANWQTMVTSQGRPRDERALRLLAFRLLAVALLLGLASGLPAVMAISMGFRLHHMFPGGLNLLLVTTALAASCSGYVAAKLYAQVPGRTLFRICALLVVPVGAFVPFCHLSISGYGHLLWYRTAYAAKTPIFDGDSRSLTQTAVVPTLDSPCPPQKNVIWCSSFQLAWNVLRDDAVGAPLEVVGAEAVAERLNTAEQSMADLEADSVYAAAGWVKDGVIETIRREMATRFPAHPLPDFNDYDQDDTLLAYAYLTAQVPFTYPFRQVNEEFAFCDSRGTQTDVHAFGLWQAHLEQYENMRKQIEILFCHSKDPQCEWQADEYALDLCRHSQPYQVVVAVVEPNESLAATYDDVQRRIAEFRQRTCYEQARQFSGADILMVPEMFWEIDHHFEELIGKFVANPNVRIPIIEALQTIRFRLDRSGAMLESQALVVIAAIPRRFEFNRPFLVYMKKRDAEQPFFVMWVDNAELLIAR